MNAIPFLSPKGKQMLFTALTLLFAPHGAPASALAAPLDLKCPDCSVVLISIDTLRRDHLSTYGYPRDTSPNLTEFAKTAIFFQRPFSTSGKTAQLHMSMFTSLYPGVHQISEFLDRLVVPLRRNIPTLAEIVREHGYATASFNRLKELGYLQ